MDKLVLIIPILALTGLFLWFSRCVERLRLPRRGFTPGEARCDWPARRYPLDRRDALPMLLLTAAYACTAFFGLGDAKAPESFCHFPDRGSYVDVEFTQRVTITGVKYYCGLYHGEYYYLQTTEDGESFTDIGYFEQAYSDVFKWHFLTLDTPAENVTQLRILSGKELELGELVFLDENGDAIPRDYIVCDAGGAPLFDEQDTAPAEVTYLNGAYFDEIYHARTAYEHVEKVQPYEITHPPLGKILIGIGIRIFGMNPFGWRFVGTLCGVIMVPLLYLFLKNLFGKRCIAVCGTAMFAFDFMHFTQTRIATIDTYAVLFILISYLFMYRWVTWDWDDPFVPPWRRYIPLGLSGVFWGIGCASKWTVIYAGLGLGLIWLLHWIFRGREECRSGHGRRFRRQLLRSSGFCLVFFVAVPLCIYYVSYYPYGQAAGMEGPGMFFQKDYLDIVLHNQEYMLTYHVGVDSTHPYSSSWYQWLVDGRPILYWLTNYEDGTKSSFGAFLNPLVCWGGLLCMGAMAWRSLRHSDKKALFILIGYLSQLLPWIAVPRLTFAYHYFPCLIFLVLGICHFLDLIRQSGRRWKGLVYGYSAVTTGLFVFFYPVLSGVRIPDWYSNLLGWLPSWPF